MIRLPAGPDFQRFPRVAVYAALAALVTTALFAAEGAYHWYADSGTAVTVPAAHVDAAKVPDPAPAVTSPVPAVSEAAVQAPASILPPTLTPTVPVPTRALSAEPAPGPSIRPADPAQTLIHAAAPQSAGIEAKPGVKPFDAPIANTGREPVRPAIAPRQKPQKATQQRKKQEARRPPAKQPVQARASTPRRTPAPQPNVYFERDSQLGFAPQLRKRMCNPATGQMPMQCYYPREGRERFPAKTPN